LRLCSNVTGQWAVQTALGGYQSIFDLTAPGGRLYETRAALIAAVARSKYLELHCPPQEAMYAFVGIKCDKLKDFDDQQFGLDLLNLKHILVAPGTSFNVPYKNHFRTTLLPDAKQLTTVFSKIEELLDEYAI